MSLVKVFAITRDGKPFAKDIIIDLTSIAEPAFENISGNTTVSLSESSKNVVGLFTNKVKYVLLENLATFVSLSLNSMFIGTVLSRKGNNPLLPVAAFFIDNVLGKIEADSLGSRFLYEEDGSSVPVEYVISEDVSEISTSIESGSSGSTSFDWNRPVKSLPSIGQIIGGITLNEGLENAYFAFISASLSLNNFNLAEVGDNFSPQLIGTLSPGDETLISSRKVFVDGVDTDTFPSNTINQAAPLNIIINTTYQLRANVDNNGSPTTIVSATRTQSFIYPFLHGMSSDPNLIQTNIYSSLTKLLQTQGDKTILLNGTLQTIYFAYDSSYPDLTKIEDNNGFNVTGSFTQSLLNIDSVGQSIEYTKQFKVYKSSVTTVNSANFKFLF